MPEWQCPICNATTARRLFALDPLAALPERHLAMVRCTTCGLCAMAPRLEPHELPGLYADDYAPFWRPLAEEPNRLLRWSRRRFYAPRVQWLQRRLPTGAHVLDLGCATGVFLSEVQRKTTMAVAGSDLSRSALQAAQRQALPVWSEEASHIAAHNSAFDAVTMWEVIEHVPDPLATLREVHRVLQPGGYLFISTPNVASLQAQIWGRHWAGWHLPQHLQVFSFKTLSRLLHEAGFRQVRRRSFALERFYLVNSMRNALAAHGRLRSGSPAWHAVRLLGFASWPLARLIDQTPLASALIVEARR